MILCVVWRCSFSSGVHIRKPWSLSQPFQPLLVRKQPSPWYRCQWVSLGWGGDRGVIDQKPFKPWPPSCPPLPGQHVTPVNGVMAGARREPWFIRWWAFSSQVCKGNEAQKTQVLVYSACIKFFPPPRGLFLSPCAAACYAWLTSVQPYTEIFCPNIHKANYFGKLERTIKYKTSAVLKLQDTSPAWKRKTRWE